MLSTTCRNDEFLRLANVARQLEEDYLHALKAWAIHQQGVKPSAKQVEAAIDALKAYLK